MPRRTSVLLLALLALGSARELGKRKENEDKPVVDRFAQLRVKPRLTFAATGALTVAATALQVVKPAWLQGWLGAACERGAGAALYKCVSFVDEMKSSNPLGLTMMHGALLKAIAEVLAQTIPQATPGATVWLDPMRLVRSTIASLLSSSLTFYYWTRLTFVRGMTAPGFLAAALGRRLGTSVTKMVVTQAVYRPVNVFLFLAMQSFFRGDSARQMINVLRTKFKGGLIGGIMFFAVSNMLMFSVPVPFLHPIIGAIAGLIFNVWLAMVAYKKEPTKSTETASSELPTAAELIESFAPSVAAFPATASALGAIGLSEAAVAASLYGRARAASGGKPRYDAFDTIVPATPSIAEAIR